MAKLQIPSEVTFHFQKTPGYRTYHADGAFGGVTSRGLVSVAFFHERPPIPKTQTFKVGEGGHVPNTPISQDCLEGFVRVVEAQVVMTPHVAASLGQWLIDKAKEAGVGVPLQ